MGYDVERFVCKAIDNEFVCQICKSVLQDPVETPCEHFFCVTCVNDWLSVSGTCPIDRLPLRTAELKKPSRLLRNLLGKQEIHCDYQDRGCDLTVKLENLPSHLLTCYYRPDPDCMCEYCIYMYTNRHDYANSGPRYYDFLYLHICRLAQSRSIQP